MTLPFALPDWLPWWLPIVLLVPACLYALLFLSMPFSVFGVKGRLDALEARLDDLHSELRGIALRLPDLPVGAYEEVPVELPRRRTPPPPEVSPRPPIPRPPEELEGGEDWAPRPGARRRFDAQDVPPPGRRVEPRLHRPR